ncbi:MAG: O-antigen ligase family protein [Bacteroidia bacterium]|nr:O-antigen ligase family protein [Bacteroidia bacterium]
MQDKLTKIKQNISSPAIMAAVTLLFMCMNCYFIYNNNYYFSLLPIAFVFVGVLVFKFDWLIYLIAFTVPLSVNLADTEFKLGLSLPTEPLMIIVTGLFWLNEFLVRKYPVSVLKHPIVKVVLISLLWVVITSITSVRPLVSFKFLISKSWFLTTALFIPLVLYQQLNNAKLLIRILLTGMLCVAIYTITMHAQFNFDEKTAHWIMSPFYSDHTSYGAILAMLLPPSVYFAFSNKATVFSRVFFIVLTVVLTLATLLSYTRAAWISLAAAFALFILFKLKVQLRHLLVVAGVVLFFLLINLNSLLDKLGKNDQDSSSNLTEHVASISNISTDASNLERLNRWNSAISMFKLKPVLGWGPNTYQFEYAPFQQSKYKTIISTNSGDMGNAHSEYLAPLCEQGVLGLVIWIVLLSLIVKYGFSNYYNPSIDKDTRNFSLSIFLGLITYIIHGFLNNFLDQDKIAFPFWTFVAILIATDLYYKSTTNSSSNSSL